jgi:hypothetical protein
MRHPTRQNRADAHAIAAYVEAALAELDRLVRQLEEQVAAFSSRRRSH